MVLAPLFHLSVLLLLTFLAHFAHSFLLSGSGGPFSHRSPLFSPFLPTYFILRLFQRPLCAISRRSANGSWRYSNIINRESRQSLLPLLEKKKGVYNNIVNFPSSSHPVARPSHLLPQPRRPSTMLSAVYRAPGALGPAQNRAVQARRVAAGATAMTRGVAARAAGTSLSPPRAPEADPLLVCFSSGEFFFGCSFLLFPAWSFPFRQPSAPSAQAASLALPALAYSIAAVNTSVFLFCFLLCDILSYIPPLPLPIRAYISLVSLPPAYINHRFSRLCVLSIGCSCRFRTPFFLFF